MGYLIKQKREEKGMTQVQLSKESGVSRPTIIELEKGANTQVKMGTIQKIASALGCKVSDLVF